MYEGLRAAILSLDLAPGERLTERGLESAFGASRTPARAALMRLEAEGLVGRDARGWSVTPINLVEIKDLGELREAVEAAVVRLAVERASDADVDAIGDLVQSAHDVTDEDSSLRAGRDFHIELARLSGNASMVDAVHGMVTRLARTRWLDVRTPESREQAWREHRRILDAITARDADGAAALMQEHIRVTNERLLAFLAAERRRLRGQGLSVV